MYKKEPFYTVGENANWCSHYVEQQKFPLKKLKMQLLSDPAILLLVIYHKKIMIWKYTCTPMLVQYYLQ